MPPIPVVHHRSYRQWISGVPMDALRAERILGFLLDEGWVGPRTIHVPRPAALENLQRVHDMAYLRSLDDPEVVARVMGVPLGSEEARAALALQRLAVGGTVQASRLAIRRGGPAIHLGGGFHHAAPDRGSAFCLLNDVAVAIARLRARGYGEPILVVDLDLHDGNGTRAAFARDPSVHTYSIHNEHWDEVDAAASTSLALGSGIQDGAYLDALRGSLPGVVAQHRPRLVFYLAGTDPAADDAFGDARLSGDALLERDRFVVEEVRRFSSRIPLVVLLAGGYGPSAWRYSARFLAWLYSGREVEMPDDVSLARRRVRSLEETTPERPREEGSSGEGGGGWLEWGLTPEDVAAVAPGAGVSTR
ncbi:MAG: histone deacetylase, partial [Gemmatimonadota bacterium]